MTSTLLKPSATFPSSKVSLSSGGDRALLPCAISRNSIHLRRVRSLQSAVRAAAANVEDELESPVDDLEEASDVVEPPAQALEAAQPGDSSTESLDFSLNFLWMDKNIAVAVDQVVARDQRSPVTEYFFWPRKDAWEELKVALEGKPWISARDKVLLLNRTTEVINFWQTEGEKPKIDQAQQAFPDCIFKGS